MLARIGTLLLTKTVTLIHPTAPAPAVPTRVGRSSFRTPVNAPPLLHPSTRLSVLEPPPLRCAHPARKPIDIGNLILFIL